MSPWVGSLPLEADGPLGLGSGVEGIMGVNIQHGKERAPQIRQEPARSQPATYATAWGPSPPHRTHCEWLPARDVCLMISGPAPSRCCWKHQDSALETPEGHRVLMVAPREVPSLQDTCCPLSPSLSSQPPLRLLTCVLCLSEPCVQLCKLQPFPIQLPSPTRAARPPSDPSVQFSFSAQLG